MWGVVVAVTMFVSHVNSGYRKPSGFGEVFGPTGLAERSSSA